MSEAEKATGNTIQIALLLGVAILAIAGAAWVFLDEGTEIARKENSRSQSAAIVSDPAVDTDVDDEPTVDPVVATVSSSTAAGQPVASAIETDRANTSIAESNLRKARMAADAEILIEPYEQSAVFFYSEVLAEQPANAVAKAELDSVLGRLVIEASALMDAEDYSAAYRLAQTVAAVRPDHELSRDVQQTLNSLSGELVASALDRAEQEDEAGALALIAEAESLPGQNAEYLQAVRDAVADLLETRQVAKAKANEERRQAAASATAAWMAGVRTAIDAGNLAGSGKDSALTLLKQRDETNEIARQLKSEWLTALLAAHVNAVNGGEFETAESLLAVAEAEASDSDEVAFQRQQLEATLADRESRRVIPVSELVAVSRPPAMYPRRAEERDISGWVDVEFRVGEDGSTDNIRVVAAEPADVFDRSVINAVSDWQFEPREFRGQVIEQYASARLVFRLE